MDSPAFETWKTGGVKFLAFPNEDGVCVIDENGNNYGTWRETDSFRKSDAIAIGKARLRFSVIQ